MGKGEVESTHVEQLAKGDDAHGGLILDHIALRVNDLAELEHFFHHMHVGLLATHLGQTARQWFAILILGECRLRGRGASIVREGIQ